MLRYAELLNALKSFRIAGRRASGHYDHDDTYHIGPHTLHAEEVPRLSRSTASTDVSGKAETAPVRYETHADPRTGERLHRPVRQQ